MSDTLSEKLDDAIRQQHLLLTGQAAKVFVDQNGERIEYNNSSMWRLAAYINQLKKQVNENSTGLPDGPLQFWM